MKGERVYPKKGEGSWLWLAKIAAGVLIFIVLGIHFVVNHLVAPGGLLTYADVIRYYTVPFIPILEIGFLILAVCHSFLGLRSILLDLNPGPRLLFFADRFLIILGAIAIIYGSWLVLYLASK